MQVRYELLPDDIVTFAKEFTRGTDSYNLQVGILLVMGFLFFISDFALLLVFLYVNDNSIRVPDVGPSLIVKGLVWFVLMFAMWLILTIYSKQKTNKLASMNVGNNGVFCEHLLEIDEAGFTESTEVNRGFHAWKCVESIKETESFVHITIRLGGTYYVPKRAFSNDVERASFVTTVSEYINQANVPPPPEFA